MVRHFSREFPLKIHNGSSSAKFPYIHYNLRPGQTLATFQRNILQHCCVMLRHELNGVAKRTQHFQQFCLHYSTGIHKTTMFIYGAHGPAKPPCRLFNTYADMYKYQVKSINKRTEAPKPDTKTPKNQQVEKTRGTCTPDQGSGATLGVLRYAIA